MTHRLYLDLNFMSRRDAYYLFYKNYPVLDINKGLDALFLQLSSKMSFYLSVSR